MLCFIVFCHFPMCCLGSDWIVSIPDPCLVSYLDGSKFEIITVSCLGFRQSTCVSHDCIPTSLRSICKQKSVMIKEKNRR